jgi:Dihydrodipicolinate synthetase family
MRVFESPSTSGSEDFAMTQRCDFAGVYVVIVTPFTAAGGLDEAAIRRLVSLLADEGADGLIVARQHRRVVLAR